MKQIPLDIETKFDALLVKKLIPEKLHSFYKKWLLYYLDFCQKYHFDQLSKESFSHFIEKLKDKNQTSQQQKQAFQKNLKNLEKSGDTILVFLLTKH